MATNLAIDDRLLEEALRVGGFRTKKATVNEALREFIDKRKRREILKVFEQIEMIEDYNYKEERKRR